MWLGGPSSARSYFDSCRALAVQHSATNWASWNANESSLCRRLTKRYVLRAELCTGSTGWLAARCVAPDNQAAEINVRSLLVTLPLWREENPTLRHWSEVLRLLLTPGAAAAALTRIRAECLSSSIFDNFKKKKKKRSTFIIACLFFYPTNTREPKRLCCRFAEMFSAPWQKRKGKDENVVPCLRSKLSGGSGLC